MYENYRIAICVPSPDKVDFQFYQNLMCLIMNHGLGKTTIGFFSHVSSRIVHNRNVLVAKAKAFEATHMLWIDADTVFPETGLKTLLDHGADVVCATTCKRDGNFDIFCHPMDLSDVGKDKPMIKARSVGLPFMLVKMSVYDKLQKPYFAEPTYASMGIEGQEDDAMPEDMYFCQRVIEAGFDIWVDMVLSCDIKHIGRKVYYPHVKPFKQIKKVA